MRTHHFRTSLTFAALAFAVFDAACASATKRFEQGQELEQQGQYAEAAQRYVDALKKDHSLVEARQRLLETGTRAIAAGVHDADAFAASGAHSDAADAMRKADALIHDAAD